MVSRSNIIKIFIIIILGLAPIKVDAQILDWLTEQAVDYVVDEYVGGKVSSLWGSYLDDSARSTIQQKSKELSSFSVDKSLEESPDTKYGMTQVKKPYALNYPILSDKTKSFLNSLRNKKVVMLANGKINAATESYTDSLHNQIHVGSISDVLSSTAIDSLNKYEAHISINDFLRDINNDKRIAWAINNHPELLRIYANFGESSRRCEVPVLFYWGNEANKYSSYFSKKTKFIKGIDVHAKDINGTTSLVYKGSNIASFEGNKILCEDINVMNLRPMANSVYVYDNITYYTDNMGRVVQVIQKIGKDYKGKCTQKGILSGKKYNVVKSGNYTNRVYYSLGLLQYKAPDCAINTAFIEKNENTKTVLKQIAKDLKTLEKQGQNTEMSVFVSYNTGMDCANSIVIKIDGKEYIINGHAVKATPKYAKNKEDELLFLKNLTNNVYKTSHYSGSIAGKYSIRMNISYEGNDVYGTYYYVSQGSDRLLTLKGYKQGDSIAFKEYTQDGKQEGSFNATVTSKGLEGSFVNSKGNNMSFSVVEEY